jgi:hypothetical protein
LELGLSITRFGLLLQGLSFCFSSHRRDAEGDKGGQANNEVGVHDWSSQLSARLQRSVVNFLSQSSAPANFDKLSLPSSVLER